MPTPIIPKAKGPEYYDTHTKLAMMPLKTSPWLKVYSLAAMAIAEIVNEATIDHWPNIFDIGCGAGRFAKHLYNWGYDNYFGIDFSPVMIEEARKYVPDFNFELKDVREVTSEDFSGVDIVVMLEFLEHIEDDLGLLGTIPSGMPVVFSVPNHDSAAHVRHFPLMDMVTEHYDCLIDIQSGTVDSVAGKENKRFVFRGIIR